MELSGLAQTLTETFKDGSTDLEWRINQLKALKKALEHNWTTVRFFVSFVQS